MNFSAREQGTNELFSGRPEEVYRAEVYVHAIRGGVRHTTIGATMKNSCHSLAIVIGCAHAGTFDVGFTRVGPPAES